MGWSSYNYPTTINAAGKTLTFYYDSNRQRYRQVYAGATGTETTNYVGGLLEKVTTGAGTDWRHYVKVGSQTIAIVSRQTSGTNVVRYMLQDQQGSPTNILEANGTSFVQEAFTAFGARRDPTTWLDSCQCDDLAKIKSVSRMGYTGHEAVGGASMGLNHMNGRVQDAITGRFLSADPYVTEPGNTQGYNRYAYVMNNPMRYIDPSGFAENDPVPQLDQVTVTGSRIFCDTGFTVSISRFDQVTCIPNGTHYFLINYAGSQAAMDQAMNEGGGGGGESENQQVPCLPGVKCHKPQGNPCSAASSDGTQIVVAYTHANSSTRVPFATHAFVIAFQGGKAYATRGGPGSGPGGGGNYRSRQIVGVSRPYPSAGFPDKPGDVIDYQVAGFVSLSLDEVASRMNDFAQVTTANDLQYSGSLNSNSYAFAFVESLGLGRADPTHWAPGSGNGAPSPKLQCAAGP